MISSAVTGPSRAVEHPPNRSPLSLPLLNLRFSDLQECFSDLLVKANLTELIKEVKKSEAEDGNLYRSHFSREFEERHSQQVKLVSNECLNCLNVLIRENLSRLPSLGREASYAYIEVLIEFVKTTNQDWVDSGVSDIIDGYIKGLEDSLYYLKKIHSDDGKEIQTDILSIMQRGFFSESGLKLMQPPFQENASTIQHFLECPIRQSLDLEKQASTFQFFGVIGAFFNAQELISLSEICNASMGIIHVMASLSEITEAEEEEYYGFFLTIGRNVNTIINRMAFVEEGTRKLLQPLMDDLSHLGKTFNNVFAQESWEDLCTAMSQLNVTPSPQQQVWNNTVTLENPETDIGRVGKRLQDICHLLNKWERGSPDYRRSMIFDFEAQVLSNEQVRYCSKDTASRIIKVLSCLPSTALYDYLLDYFEQNYKISFEERVGSVFHPVAWIEGANVSIHRTCLEPATIATIENIVAHGHYIVKVQTFLMQRQQEIFTSLYNDYQQKMQGIGAFKQQVIAAQSAPLSKEVNWVIHRQFDEALQNLDKVRNQKVHREIYEAYEKELRGSKLEHVDFKLDLTKSITDLLSDMKFRQLPDALMSCRNRLPLKISNAFFEFNEEEKLAIYLNIGRPIIRYKVSNPQSRISQSLVQPWGHPHLKFEIEVGFQLNGRNPYLVSHLTCEGRCDDSRILQASYKGSSIIEDLVLLNGWEKHGALQSQKLSEGQIKLREEQRTSLKKHAENKLKTLSNEVSVLKFGGELHKKFKAAIKPVEAMRGLMRCFAELVGVSDSTMRLIDQLPGKRSLWSRLVHRNEVQGLPSNQFSTLSTMVNNNNVSNRVVYVIQQQVLQLRLIQLGLSFNSQKEIYLNKWSVMRKEGRETLPPFLPPNSPSARSEIMLLGNLLSPKS